MRKQSAAEQFAAFGIPPTDWTPAMALAVKQKWSGLPVDVKVDELRVRIASVTVDDVASVEDLIGAGMNPDDAAAERTRLLRNAKVKAWRARQQLTAALEARQLKFDALRASKSKAAASAAEVPTTTGTAN